MALVARGGSTLGWSGDAYRLRPEDFRLNSQTGQGLDWPLSYDELEPYYTLAEQVLRVSGEQSDIGHPPRSAPFPHPAKPYHFRDRYFLNALAKQGWPSMHHNFLAGRRWWCICGRRVARSIGQKPSLPTLHTLHCQSHSVRFQTARPTPVQCYDRAKEHLFNVGAQTVVVCAGGIETPNLLRQSANKWWSNGLGNHSGHLGRHLISHTGIALGGRPRGFRFSNGPIGPTVSTRHFDSERDQPSGKYILIWRPAPSGLLFVNAMLEQFPGENNAVKLGTGKTRFGTPNVMIDYNEDEQHRRKIRVVTNQLESFATQARLKVVVRRHFVHAHPMCTSRMSDDDHNGVIDSDLRIHPMDNVYVCGSAGFSTGGAANPTVTIAALAFRLGKRLCDN